MDTFPELEGKAERWLALDSVGNATESCRIAEDAGVDRLLHAQLADELLSPVGPGALLYLMDRGIWLPNTINGASDISFPTVDAKANREEASVLFVLDDELAFCNDLRFPLKVLEGEIKAFGCRTREMSLRAFTLETLDELPSHLVLLSDRPEIALWISRWTKIHSIVFATLENSAFSPLRCVFAGRSYPEAFSLGENKLRPFFTALGRLVKDLRTVEPEIAGTSSSYWSEPESCDAMVAALADSNDYSRSVPAVFASFLETESGARFLKWAKARIYKHSCFQYTALFYSLAYFRERNPFAILCDKALLEQSRSGLSLLRELLEAGYKASRGKGILYTLYLSWCSILLGEPEKTVKHFASARAPSFAAFSGYASEIGLALWYSGQRIAALECAKLAKAIQVSSDTRSCRFDAVCALVEGGLIDEKAEKELLASSDWVAVQAAALAGNADKENLWRGARELNPFQTEAFAKA